MTSINKSKIVRQTININTRMKEKVDDKYEDCLSGWSIWKHIVQIF
jgi:hypothetical protein